MVSTAPTLAQAPPSTTPAIEALALSAAQGQRIVLSRVTFSIPAGSLTALVGPPGAGKSTLLRCLLGLTTPRAGEVRLFGESAGRGSRLLSYIPQLDLIDWGFPISVADVVMMGRCARLGYFQRPRARDLALVVSSLADLKLGHLAQRRAAELNPGERRRALLARALAQEPRVLLLDEPLAGLDAAEGGEVFDVLDSLRRRGMTVLLATRDLASVGERFDQVILLNGRVVAQGPRAEVFTRANLEEAYGAHPVSLDVGAGHFAVNA